MNFYARMVVEMKQTINAALSGCSSKDKFES